MDFVKKSFQKNETQTSWTLSQHICSHFWAWLLNTIAIMPKSEDKYVVKVFNSSEFHLSEMTLLQNPYFSKFIHPLSFNLLYIFKNNHILEQNQPCQYKLFEVATKWSNLYEVKTFIKLHCIWKNILWLS